MGRQGVRDLHRWMAGGRLDLSVTGSAHSVSVRASGGRVTDSEPRQIFISYSHEDGVATMEMLRREVPRRLPGHVAWSDQQIPPNAELFSREIEKALRASVAVFIVLTPASATSVWCARKILQAR